MPAFCYNKIVIRKVVKGFEPVTDNSESDAPREDIPNSNRSELPEWLNENLETEAPENKNNNNDTSNSTAPIEVGHQATEILKEKTSALADDNPTKPIRIAGIEQSQTVSAASETIPVPPEFAVNQNQQTVSDESQISTPPVQNPPTSLGHDTSPINLVMDSNPGSNILDEIASAVQSDWIPEVIEEEIENSQSNKAGTDQAIAEETMPLPELLELTPPSEDQIPDWLKLILEEDSPADNEGASGTGSLHEAELVENAGVSEKPAYPQMQLGSDTKRNNEVLTDKNSTPEKGVEDENVSGSLSSLLSDAEPDATSAISPKATPENNINFTDQARSMLNAGKHPEEITQLLSGWLKDHPGSKEGWELLGDVLLKSNQPDKAFDAYSRASRL